MPDIVAITGASGYIGSNLCRRLASSGSEAVGLVRSESGEETVRQAGGEPVRCPPVEADTFANCLSREVDAVVHLAAHVHRPSSSDDRFKAVNVTGAENAAKLAMQCNARTFLFFSTAAVYGDSAADGPIGSSSALRPATAYARSKLEAEEMVAELLANSATALKIVRVPMIYGPNAPGNFSRLCKLVSTGLPLPLSAAKSRRNLLYVENLTDAVYKILQSPDDCPDVALIADRESISTAELVRTIAAAMKSRTALFPLPRPMIETASRLVRQHRSYVSLFESMEIDSGEFATAMRWVPPFTATDAIRRSVDNQR